VKTAQKIRPKYDHLFTFGWMGCIARLFRRPMV